MSWCAPLMRPTAGPTSWLSPAMDAIASWVPSARFRRRILLLLRDDCRTRASVSGKPVTEFAQTLINSVIDTSPAPLSFLGRQAIPRTVPLWMLFTRACEIYALASIPLQLLTWTPSDPHEEAPRSDKCSTVQGNAPNRSFRCAVRPTCVRNVAVKGIAQHVGECFFPE